MSAKRGPSVLVTDSRERPPSRPGHQRQGTAAFVPGRPPMHNVSVDRVLRHNSQIPSGLPRTPPAPRQTGSIAAARAAARRAVPAGGLPTLASARTGQQNVPSRTTKISEKLVLIPDTPDRKSEDDDDSPEDDKEAKEHNKIASALIAGESEDGRPLKDEELDVLRKRRGIRGKSWAERLTKPQRTEKVSRVTAYCTAQAFKMKATAEFLRVKHEAKTKLYDDCLYVVYHLPLLSGNDGYRLRSRPILKTPGTGKTVLDLEIERSERRDEHYAYFDDYATDANGNTGAHDNQHSTEQDHDDHGGNEQLGQYRDEETSLSPVNQLAPDVKKFAEMFVFSYGVVVFWNFSEHQEKGILADLTFAENDKGPSLVTRPFDHSDYETEEFHFEYSADAKRPRVFNDMITLLPRSDHMVKLSISHAVAQSTKLCYFEGKMAETMQEAQHVPKTLALTGELKMTRKEIVRIMGRLFRSRVDINLSSNILDVPNFFWESEPNLHPLYVAIREYLEIDPRIKGLNERCRVFLDLAEILSDSVADAKMSSITWIIIVLIVLSIVVTVSEVGLRFGILSHEKGKNGMPSLIERNQSQPGGVAQLVQHGDLEWKLARKHVTLQELREWSAQLDEQERTALCGAIAIGKTYADV